MKGANASTRDGASRGQGEGERGWVGGGGWPRSPSSHSSSLFSPLGPEEPHTRTKGGSHEHRTGRLTGMASTGPLHTAVAGKQRESQGDGVRQADHAHVQAKNNMRWPHPVRALAKQENIALARDTQQALPLRECEHARLEAPGHPPAHRPLHYRLQPRTTATSTWPRQPPVAMPRNTSPRPNRPLAAASNQPAPHQEPAQPGPGKQ